MATYEQLKRWRGRYPDKVRESARRHNRRYYARRRDDPEFTSKARARTREWKKAKKVLGLSSTRPFKSFAKEEEWTMVG